MSAYIKKYEQLAEVPKRRYTGYIWKSDRKYPEVLDGTKEITVTAEQNPFIVEALLIDEALKISVMVRHAGVYMINEFYMNKIPETAKVEKDRKGTRLNS